MRSLATLVITNGVTSMEALARELRARIPVEPLRTNIYPASAGRFNVSWKEALGCLGRDAAFIRRLRKVRGVVHLPNHHLARYGLFVGEPYVVTVHDLIRQLDRGLDQPLIHRPTRRDRLLLALDARGIRRASAVIAISEHTRHALIRHLRISPERIAVIPPGIDLERFRPVRGTRPVPYRFLLFVGSEHPRKNLAGLLRVLRELKAEARFADLRLVKVGDPGAGEADFRQATLRALTELGLDGDVILRGRVSHDELVRLYSAAECLVLPSLYEGYGLPPIEAMACGCPVVVSDRGALPETTGGAALVTDPGPEPLADAVQRVVEDSSLRRRLVEAGHRHVRGLSWERTAEQTIGVYERLLQAKSSNGRWRTRTAGLPRVKRALFRLS
jgi:glycosyltransferase involved in cell wall biosynthesis